LAENFNWPNANEQVDRSERARVDHCFYFLKEYFIFFEGIIAIFVRKPKIE
jgi:hypothetical protein